MKTIFLLMPAIQIILLLILSGQTIIRLEEEQISLLSDGIIWNTEKGFYNLHL